MYIYLYLVNYHEFEVQKYEDMYSEENLLYTCVVVLLHALLKCTNDKFRVQLSVRMDNEEQILLARFLEATQGSLFTKQNISEALMLTSNIKLPNLNESGKFNYLIFFFFLILFYKWNYCSTVWLTRAMDVLGFKTIIEKMNLNY